MDFPDQQGVLWAGFLILLNDIYFGFVVSLCGDSNKPFPPEIVLCFCVLDTIQDESVMVFEVRVELNPQSAITVTSLNKKAIQHKCIVCPVALS